jgi:hypothetical protein
MKPLPEETKTPSSVELELAVSLEENLWLLEFNHQTSLLLFVLK